MSRLGRLFENSSWNLEVTASSKLKSNILNIKWYRFLVWRNSYNRNLFSEIDFAQNWKNKIWRVRIQWGNCFHFRSSTSVPGEKKKLTVYRRLLLSVAWPSNKSFFVFFFEFVLVQTVTRSFMTLLAIRECIDQWHMKIKWNRKFEPVDLQKSNVFENVEFCQFRFKYSK